MLVFNLDISKNKMKIRQLQNHILSLSKDSMSCCKSSILLIAKRVGDDGLGKITQIRKPHPSLIIHKVFVYFFNNSEMFAFPYHYQRPMERYTI